MSKSIMYTPGHPRKLIYVAGPYTQGDVNENVANAIKYGMQLNDEGHFAIIPHLTHFADIICPRGYEYWIELDNRIIPLCDELHRLPGKSPGSDNEVKLAKKYNIPIVKVKKL